ncbi:MAG: hypothetical protein WBF20_16155 [Trebonia sp.]|uniref:hypothetical protein n=1 Tax=Trebonia sp. TaxID=2767075 RepID=UPI003BCA6154
MRSGPPANQGTDPANSRARRDTPASDPEARFPGKYEHRVVEGGIGHNLPQEAPQAFAQAIIDAAGF